MKRYTAVVACVIGIAASPALTWAGQWSTSGELTLEARYFPYAAEYPNQKNINLSPSASLEPEIVYESDNGNHIFTTSLFARKDTDDSNRTHTDIRELNWLYLGPTWDMMVGASKVYWGVTESAHLVDIINQTDAVEDLTGEDKLGQAMVNFNIEQIWGSVNLFVLPGFRPRAFTADNARLHGPIAIDGENPTYESADKDNHLDWAVRWTQTFDDMDVGLSHFQGTSREARLIPQLSGGELTLVPHYDLIAQTGFELQLTTENTLWKAEGISRSGQGDRFYAVVAGFEHTLYGIAGSSMDMGVLLEYLYDNRDVNTAPPSIAEHDVFGGFRVTMNDTQDTAILFGTMVDYKTDAMFINLEAERRLTNQMKLEFNARFLTNIPDEDTLAFIRDDDFMSLKVSYFF